MSKVVSCSAVYVSFCITILYGKPFTRMAKEIERLITTEQLENIYVDLYLVQKPFSCVFLTDQVRNVSTFFIRFAT